MAIQTLGRVPYSDSIKWGKFYEGNSDYACVRGESVQHLRENMLRFVEDVLDIPAGSITEDNLEQLRHLLRHSISSNDGCGDTKWLSSVKHDGAYIHARTAPTGLLEVYIDTEDYPYHTKEQHVPYVTVTLNEGQLFTPADADRQDPTTAGEVLRKAITGV